jgi:hypothetical protein
MKDLLIKTLILGFWLAITVLAGVENEWSAAGMIAFFIFLLVGGEFFTALKTGSGLIFYRELEGNLETNRPLPVSAAQLLPWRIVVTLLAGLAGLLHGLSMEWPADSIIIAGVGATVIAWLFVSMLAAHIESFRAAQQEVVPVTSNPQPEKDTRPVGTVIGKPLPFPVRYAAVGLTAIQTVVYGTFPLWNSDPAISDSPWIWAGIGFLFASATSVSMFIVSTRPGNTLGKW